METKRTVSFTSKHCKQITGQTIMTNHKLFEPFRDQLVIIGVILNVLFSVYLILPPICLIIHEFGK